MSRQDNPTGFSKAGVGGHATRSMMYLEMRDAYLCHLGRFCQGRRRGEYPGKAYPEQSKEKSPPFIRALWHGLHKNLIP
jgi:hypothetical protein